MHTFDEPKHEAAAMLLTPPGRGAVASISVTGTRALACLAEYFRSARGMDLRDTSISQIAYGRWGSASGEEIVVCRVNEETVEVHCHGGHAASARILNDLAALGANVQSWQSTCREVHAASIRAEALLALTKSTTARTAAVLWDQYRGAMECALAALRAYLRADDLAAAGQAIDSMLAFAEAGLHLTEPWRVVLVGPPNVGKSSLLNALLGFGRAIVHDQPGTTRDLVTGDTAFGGWPCSLVDTAGLREAMEPVEKAGVRLAADEMQRADLVLWIRDLTDAIQIEPNWEASDLAKTLVVWNKWDLLSGMAPLAEQGVAVSALTGQGIEQLSTAIAERLVPHVPPRGAAVPFHGSHVERLRSIRHEMRNGRAQAALAALESWLALQRHTPLPGEICE